MAGFFFWMENGSHAPTSQFAIHSHNTYTLKGKKKRIDPKEKGEQKGETNRKKRIKLRYTKKKL